MFNSATTGIRMATEGSAEVGYRARSARMRTTGQSTIATTRTDAVEDAECPGGLRTRKLKDNNHSPGRTFVMYARFFSEYSLFSAHRYCGFCGVILLYGISSGPYRLGQERIKGGGGGGGKSV